MKDILRLEDVLSWEERVIRRTCGGKTVGLSRISACGFRQPSTLIISTGAFDKFLRHNNFSGTLAPKPSPQKDVFVISEHLQRTLHDGEMPCDLIKAIASHSTTLGSAVAVRSSGTLEDGAVQTFAGAFASLLDIKPNNGIAEAVIKCWSSLYSPQALFYAGARCRSSRFKMAVVLQTMLVPEFSGICSSSFQSPKTALVECTMETCDRLTSGEISPDRYLIEKRTGRIIDERHSQDRLQPAIPKTYLEAIARAATDLEERLCEAQVIEWCFQGGQLFLLQCRPFRFHRQRTFFSNYHASLTKPVLKGVVFIPEKISPSEHIRRNSILVISDSHPRYLPYLASAAGVVCENGGILNHFAIACREIGIPFIQLPRATEILQSGSMAELVFRENWASKPFADSTEEVMAFHYRYHGRPPLKKTIQGDLRIVRRLPQLIGKTYKLRVRVVSDNVMLQQESLARFLSDVLDNLDVLYAHLVTFNEMDERQQFAVAVLAMISVDQCLFANLEKRGQGRNESLRSIRTGSAHYLELDGSFSASLAKYGMELDSVKTPESIRKKRGTKAAKTNCCNALPTSKHELLAAILRLIVDGYENKNRMQ